MSCITKCQRFKGRFSEVDVWSPIIAKRIVSRPIIAIFSFPAPFQFICSTLILKLAWTILYQVVLPHNYSYCFHKTYMSVALWSWV